MSSMIIGTQPFRYACSAPRTPSTLSRADAGGYHLRCSLANIR
jgi:hypothetical protein